MATNSHRSKNRRWKTHIDVWRSSGKNMRQWCQEHNIPLSTFAYWKDKFSCDTLDKRAFIEIAEAKSTGITIKCNAFELHIEQSFDELALSRCLKVMRSILC
jgi:hypothetical protein